GGASDPGGAGPGPPVPATPSNCVPPARPCAAAGLRGSGMTSREGGHEMSLTVDRHILAIDLGTSALKVALVSVAGEVVAAEEEAHQVQLLPGGGAEQDPEGGWVMIARVSSRLMARGVIPPDAIAAVSCTAQWSGTVPANEDGRPVRNAIIWMDSRGAPYPRRITSGPVRVSGYGADKLARWIRKTVASPRTAARTHSRTSCGSSTRSRRPTAPPACSWSPRTG